MHISLTAQISNKNKIFVSCIVGISLLLGLLSSFSDSLTNDEVAHIGAGYSYLVKHNMRLNPEHPPIIKDLSALPLLFLNINKEIFALPVYWLGDIAGESQWIFGHLLIFKSGVNADKILQLARLPMLIFFVLTVLLILKWGRQLYGDRAAIMAVVIFAFSPTVIAHAKLVTSDMATTAGVFLSTHFFIKYLESRSSKNLLTAGLTLGLAFGIKFSTLLLLPFFFILALTFGILKKESVPRLLYETLAVIFIGAALLVPIYYFNMYRYSPAQQTRDTEIILNDLGRDGFIAKTTIKWAEKPGLRIISHYLLGLEMVNDRVSSRESIYLMGSLQSSGSIIYFPLIYFIKEPLPWLILLIAALIVFFRQVDVGRFRDWGAKKFTELAMVLWILIYLSATLNSNLTIGIRHLLPIYPFIILIVSGLVSSKFNKLKFYVAFLLVWYVIDAFAAYPNYISYFSEIVGGSGNGYKYAVDSNLDWGQDLKRLGRWADKHNVEKIELDYFGWAAPEYYLSDKFIPIKSDKYKSVQEFVKHNQSEGLIAVSATTLLQESYSSYTWLRPYIPSVSIGHSIYVWRITQPILDRLE